uniref:Alpha-2-macroglobulin-like protein 1 n=1 Tax=Hippocampus comes TaxID=109280 RepID=A0A3Q2Y2W7_HIPCM
MCSCQQKWLDQICWCDQQKKVGSTRNTSAKASVEPSCIIFHFSIFCYICCLKRNPVTLHLSCLLAQCLCFSGPCSIFAVTVSSRVRGGSQETLCALIQGPTELVSLSITLDTDTGSAVILEKAVPAVRTNTVATINVTVKGESATMNKKTKILIVPPAFIHIIQTDKPIYKPGQTGKYRHNQNINKATQGTYVITATTDKGEKISHSFDIKEYVLPKFEVTVHLPSVISILDQQVTLQTDHSGCATETVSMADFALNKNTYADSFVVDAELEEHGTGVILKGTGRTRFSAVIRTVTFEDVPEAYKPGIPFEGKVLTLFELQRTNCTLKPEYRAAYHGVSAFYSKSSSFLKLMQVSGKIPCDKDATVRAQYVIQGQELKKRQESLDFFYLVSLASASGGVAPTTTHSSSTLVPHLPGLCHGSSSIPWAVLVVYTVLPGGEAVADSQDFPIQLCLKNKVSLKFPSIQELPAEKTTLKLQAQPGSLCSVRAIDQSILLLQSERELTVGYVRQLLLHAKTFPTCLYTFFFCCDLFGCCCSSVGVVVLLFFRFCDLTNLSLLFQGIGVKLSTNSDVKKPDNCQRHKYADLEEADFGMFAKVQTNPHYVEKTKEEKKETIRTFFPETWIWDLVSVGDAGTVNVEKTVPDTITQWAAGAFCVSSVGFGVAPTTALTVFQPFFVSLTLPYSVIRGEMFTLKATVFNYLSKCIMVKVTLAQSDTYTFRNCDDCQYSVCLCSEQSRTFTWIVTPTALGKIDLKVSAEAVKTSVLCGNEVASVPDVGRIDTMVRSLLVEAEGTPQSVSHNALLCPAGTGPVEKNISLLMPEMFVAASARATVSVLGDLMGRAIKNLDQLLAMPYGCGEQNMLLFAPNIFILNYLKSTDQLTAEILDKATHFLESGYQRELTYKHDDGSYSAFGKSDASGNTWLTSFVMKSFGGARPYIFVDPKHILDAKKWLYSKQGSDGCIRSVGKLFHNGMKVMTAVCSLACSHTPRVVGCLRVVQGGNTGALGPQTRLNAHQLAGNQVESHQKVRRPALALICGYVSVHPTLPTVFSAAIRFFYTPPLDSLEVEITSYVLLALLSGPALPDFGLDYSSSIVRWLTQQQNPYGGFSSTQDTVVALQALAKYGAATYSVGGKTTVTVTSLGGLNKEFIVDQSNRLLYQEEKLSDVPGEYTIKAEGQSCVLAQLKKGETVVYSMTLEQDVPVRNLKAAVVKVYDYYQTSDVAVTEYTSPCAESKSHGSALLYDIVEIETFLYKRLEFEKGKVCRENAFHSGQPA